MTVRQSLQCGISLPGKNISLAASRYLDIAEGIVYDAVKWQREDGRIIDPYVNQETNTVTARYVGALGLLIQHGRCLDLSESCAKALTPALEDLFNRKTGWGEFIVKEACMAYVALKDRVTAELAGYWKHLLGDYDPELAYSRTFTNHPSDLQNFCTFAIAGESIKKKLELADNQFFMDRYIEQQLPLFDENGMYIDPHSPMTYDAVSRMNLTLALWAGYEGKYFEKLNEVLEKGAFSQLLYQSSTGECPFGGRSNQQNFNEVTFALICEYEAVRWKKKGDLKIAGAFKRSAALAINAIEKYLEARPIFFTKNMFPPETQHGREKGYGFYGAYSLLIASQLGFASLLADESIKEEKCPAECGGYIFETGKDFHKIFAASVGIHIEIERNADFHYDATGLGRIHFAGCPSALALSIPITPAPNYLVSIPESPENVSIGPGSNGNWLAAMNGTKLLSKCKILKEGKDGIEFSVDYSYEDISIAERYIISEKGLDISASWKDGNGISFRVPLLETDGCDNSEIKVIDNGFEVFFKDFIYRVQCADSGAKTGMEDFRAPNRNGIYKVAIFSSLKNTININFRILKKSADPE